MQLINYSSEEFKVASERTEGIPLHAVEIDGDLIHINTLNLEQWGIKSAAVDEIINKGLGMPVRMCNNKDPHACDYIHDHSSDVGYVTKMWQDGEWIKARAAITDHTASKKVNDGTWTPLGKGKWSVAGYPGDEIDTDGMMNSYIPAAISFVPPPYKPAFVGSSFKLVVAAVNEHKEKLQSEYNKHRIKEEIMTEDKDGIKTDDSKKIDEQDDTNDVKTEPKTKVNDDDRSKDDEVTMYDQDALDKRIADALGKQKIEYETQMANMTPTVNLEPMLAAAKTETINEIRDELNREKLTNEYMEMLAASTILKAPFMVDGKLDETKLSKHGNDTKMLSASVIETKIEHANAMVAAMPSGNTVFDSTNVKNKSPNSGFDFKSVDNEFKSRLGVR